MTTTTMPPPLEDLMPHSMRLGDECTLDGKTLRVVRLDVPRMVEYLGVAGALCSLCPLYTHPMNTNGAWCCMAARGADHGRTILVDTDDTPKLAMKGLLA